MFWRDMPVGEAHALKCAAWLGVGCDCDSQERPPPEAVPADPRGSGGHSCESIDASDTDRPPPSSEPKACYFCGEPAEWSVYHAGIPSCSACARRADGLRRRGER